MTNLALLLDPTEQSERLRKIIIDKQKPTFQPKLPRTVATRALSILQRLNRVQQRAVLKAVSANDYILITGMPGTGKTSTVVALIQLLVELDQSVIVTSHTHSAVDNVCLRLMRYGVENILRLGDSSKIHPSLREKSETEVTKSCKTPEELERCYNDAVSVRCGCSSSCIYSRRVRSGSGRGVAIYLAGARSLTPDSNGHRRFPKRFRKSTILTFEYGL